MFGDDTDRQWEKFGRADPYFGVITDETYRQANLTEEAKKRFFRSGELHVEHVVAQTRKHLAADIGLGRVLDFGCGVGRTLIPFCAVAQHVVGADISPSMLEEAKRNCDIRSVQNASLVLADDAFLAADDAFDLVHSSIVFQHVPMPRGIKIFRALMGKLVPGGIGVMEMAYAALPDRRLGPWLKRNVPWANSLANLFRGRPVGEPMMQMNAYDLNQVFAILQSTGVVAFYAEFTDHGGYRGITLYCRKPQIDR
ncbi:MAG: class I SAM-dependent methyltransferase [Geminicoccaceae bacterium]